MSSEKVSLRVIVAGEEASVVANVNAPLRSVAERALAVTGNSGRPLDEWEFKDANGKLLDITRKVGDLNFVDGVLLYLTLIAGING
jgi:hypothetical protein